MAQNLNKLIPYLYAALDIVSRELVGLIPAVARDATADGIAKGHKLVVPVANVRGTVDIVPGSPPAVGGSDFDTVEITIDKFKSATPIGWNGEEEYAVGGKLNQMKVDQFTQAMRGLVNEMETDLAIEGVSGAIGAGNVYGIPGTAPFNGSVADMANVAKILDDKGAPLSDRQIVLNSLAMTQLRSLTNLTNVNKAGTDETLRRGIVGELMGFDIHQSAGFKAIASGDGAGYLLNGVADAGAIELTIDSGTGVINKGALITIDGDTNKYIVTEAVPNGGTLLKIAGGLKQGAADNAAITLSSTPYLANLALTRNSLLIAARVPKLPRDGDQALDVTTITDPVSGITFQVAIYPGYMENRVEIQAAWGTKSIIGRHTVALLG